MTIRFCPFLGLDSDPDTRMNFPSERNFCQRAKPPAAVGLTHQSMHCLNSNHLRCPMFAAKTPGNLPAALSAAPPSHHHGRNLLLSGLLVMGLAVVFLFVWWQEVMSALPAPLATDYIPATAAVTESLPTTTPEPSALPSSTPLPPATETPLPPSATEQPTESAEPALTQAVCSGPPAGWVPYTVQAGDTLFQISLTYGISLQRLQDANCLNDASLIRAGQKLYVPNSPTRTAPPPSPTPEPLTPTWTEIPPSATAPPPTATATEIPPSPVAETPTPHLTP